MVTVPDDEMMEAAKAFIAQCDDAGEKIISLLFSYRKPVVACVLPGVLAAVMRTFDIPREAVIAMLDSALEDIG